MHAAWSSGALRTLNGRKSLIGMVIGDWRIQVDLRYGVSASEFYLPITFDITLRREVVHYGQLQKDCFRTITSMSPAYICHRDVRRTSQTNHLWIRYVEVSSLGPGANKFMCSNRWSKGTVYKSSLEKAGNCFVLFVLWFRMTINVTLKYFGVSAFVVNRNHRMVMDKYNGVFWPRLMDW